MKQNNFLQGIRVFDSFTLKIIGVASMLVDHIGLMFFPDVEILRVIGRIALPIFAFLLTEGLLKTRNLKAYMLRLVIFAFISQVPYGLFNYVTGHDPFTLNIFFLLALGLGALALARRVKDIWLQIIIVMAAAILATIFRIDYGAYGILLILSCYLIHRRAILGATLLVIFTLFTLLLLPYPKSLIQAFAIVSLPFILGYAGKPGIKISRWWFYWFYPIHLALLSAIYVMLQRWPNF
jgi:hypothetical protein